MNHVTRLSVLLALVVTGAFAQRDLSTLAGTVTDSSGGVVPNAVVTITETSTGLTYTTVTNTTGEFVRPALKPSTYTVSVTAPGFKKAEQTNVVLTAGERTAVTLTLSVGDVGQTVEVTASAAILQTEGTQVGANVESRQVDDLPLGGTRNLTYLARLSPGVVPAEPGARDAANGGFSANGVRSNGQNNFLLNGVDNNINTIDFLNQTAYAIGPSVEAVQEINIITNGYNAEYGRAAGGVMNVNLKSGTNTVHGTLFELLQNKVLDANRWENNLAGQPRGPFIGNQFGAAAGGPIIKNKLFIFGDYQGTRISDSGGAVQNLGYSGFLTLPTAAMKTGNFSSELGSVIGTDPVTGSGIVQGGIYDPLSGQVSSTGTPTTRTMFAGNMIPQSRFDPSFAKILALYPTTNQTIKTGTYPANDFYYVTPGRRPIDQGDGRVDYQISPKDLLFGSLSWSDEVSTDGVPFPGPLDGSPFNGAQEIDLARNAQLSYTRTWKPTMISETRVAFTRLVTSRLGGNPGVDLFQQFGMGGYDPTTATANNGGLPQISFGNGYPQTGANDWIPTKEFNNVWDFIQNVAITKGSHGLKFGAEFRPIKFPFFQVPDPHGNVSYSANETAFPLTTKGSTGAAINTVTGDSIASALLGQIDNAAISTTNFVSSQKSAWAWYAQDDWKVNSKLTINLGLRYELWSPIDERFGRQANFNLQNLTLYIPSGSNQNAPLPPNFATAFPEITVSRGTVPSTLIPWDKTDFGPRIGIAYRVLDKTVIRAGFGMFYGGEENQGGSPNRGEGVPFNETVNLQRANGVSSFVGISMPQCTGCNYMPNGLVSGYPLNVFTLPAPVSFRGVQPDFRNPLVQKWNLVVQHELPGNMALEIGYDGNHSARQVILWNSDASANIGTTNSAITGSTQAYIQPPAGCTACALISSGLSMTSSFGFGNYSALHAQLVKRLSNGLDFQAAYTWSHALADSATPLSGSTGLGTPDPTNFASEYSSASWDIRHSFTAAFNYELPFGKGKSIGSSMNRFANAIVGNWMVNGILALRTGVPYTLRYNGCQGVWGACVPDLVPGANANAAPSSGRSPNQWFNIANLTVPAPLTGGDLGLQSQTGPPTRTLDFSIFKDFHFTERYHLEFRAEGTNIANTPQFNIPDNNLQDSPLLGGNGNFGKITGTGPASERHIQFQLRFMF
ncbi:MAG TPA: carboxypeptidase regulatory-like domain-containing protein [Bryobacteraceae bacterium]|nr:carboxypeptidase regulatory-like domain-containing protein [Bryobacteraceae bacterium]